MIAESATLLAKEDDKKAALAIVNSEAKTQMLFTTNEGSSMELADARKCEKVLPLELEKKLKNEAMSEKHLSTPTSTHKKRISSSTIAWNPEAKAAKKQWAVNQLLNHEMRAGILHFLVRWEGYGSDDDSWEPEKNLSCPKLLSAYKIKNKLK